MKLRFHHILYFCSLVLIISLLSKEMPSTVASVYELSLSNHSNSNDDKQQGKEFPKEEKEEDNEGDLLEDDKEENDKDNYSFLASPPNLSQQATTALAYTAINLNDCCRLTHRFSLPFYILFACQKINC